jgi:hypothetical protein
MSSSLNARDDDAGSVSDAELTALALAADPATPLSKDATAWTGATGAGGLPAWYMPRPTARSINGVARIAIVAVVVGFLIIDAFGLCITSGFISLA